MTPRAAVHRSFAGAWRRAGAVVAAGLAVTAFGQVGITGNALGPSSTPIENYARNSQFDNAKLHGQSALGQLEEMTKTKVDRSAAPAAMAAPAVHKPSAKAIFNANVRTMATGMLLEAVFANVFSDNGAAERAAEEKAAAEKAAAELLAAQQAELMRQIALVRAAAAARAEWDAREEDIVSAFTTSGGTAFFGTPVAPDDAVASILGTSKGRPPGRTSEIGEASIEWDTSVVDLRGHAGVVPVAATTSLPRMPGGARSGSGWYEGGAPDATAEWAFPELKPRTGLEEWGLHYGTWYVGTVKDIPMETLWGLAENLPGQKRLKEIWGWRKKFNDLSDPLHAKENEAAELIFGSGQRLIRTMAGSGGEAELIDSHWSTINELSAGAQSDAREAIFGEVMGKAVDTPDLSVFL